MGSTLRSILTMFYLKKEDYMTSLKLHKHGIQTVQYILLRTTLELMQKLLQHLKKNVINVILSKLTGSPTHLICILLRMCGYLLRSIYSLFSTILKAVLLLQSRKLKMLYEMRGILSIYVSKRRKQ